MQDRLRDQGDGTERVGVNPGYATYQLAKALSTSQEHSDSATRERARERIVRWETVLRNVLTGSLDYGSRTPVADAPAWATLEVVTGGFATGALLAGGKLQDHEQEMLTRLPPVPTGGERQALNAYFLTEGGLSELQRRLSSGSYDIRVPEEGALLAVAWLAGHGYVDDAGAVLDAIAPFFDRLRFYPVPLERARRHGSRVHLQNVGKTVDDIRAIKPNQRILAQKEAVEVWTPLYDRIVGLFLETVEGDWPCRIYPGGWKERASALLSEYAKLRKLHQLTSKPERKGKYFTQLRECLIRCVSAPTSLTGREVGRIRLILHRYQQKRGRPDSPACTAARERQCAAIAAPTFHEIAAIVLPRLASHPANEGLDDVGHLSGPISAEEAVRSGIPQGTAIPESIRRKVERCLNETVDILVERGLITSGETLARVLPQMTSGLRAGGIVDADLRGLYASVYRAFRRRRSLLLLNLEKQVQIEELPWVAAVDRFRTENLSARNLARQALEEVAVLTLTSFPHAILPNKLLQEMSALVKQADVELPLVEEVAADIFMGRFTDKYVNAAKIAAGLLDRTLYGVYYGIDFDEVRRLPDAKGEPWAGWWFRRSTAGINPLAQLCATRAGVSLGTWDPATNGMIIEQEQILTTHNLAALFDRLGLAEQLGSELIDMAKACFRWVCQRQQLKLDKWHARLIMVKNTAYAWRQMIFFLSLRPSPEVSAFLTWAEEHLNSQAGDFRTRFFPVLRGLMLAAQRVDIGADAGTPDGRRFLGWSKTRHWLLPETGEKNRS